MSFKEVGFKITVYLKIIHVFDDDLKLQQEDKVSFFELFTILNEFFFLYFIHIFLPKQIN